MSIIFTDKIYDILKYIAQIVLPLLATFYAAIAEIWGLPFAVEIPATITAVDAFLGGLLVKASKDYNKNQTSTDETSAGE